MPKLLKKIIKLFGLLLILLFLLKTTTASFASIPAEEGGGEGCITDSDYVEITPCEVDINTGANTVKIKFKGLKPNQKYYYCLETDLKDCSTTFQGDVILKDSTTIKTQSDGTSEQSYCAASGSKLKTDCDAKDYFHEGKTYRVTVFDNRSLRSNPLEARFTVSTYFPQVNVTVSGAKPATANITIAGVRPPRDDKKKNNYMVILQGRDIQYQESGCATLPPGTQSNVSFSGLGRGHYLAIVKDQVSEDNTFLRRVAAGVQGHNPFFSCIPGNLTYWQIPICISEQQDIKGGKDTFCTRGSVGTPIKDPHGTILKRDTQEDALRQAPCAEKDANGICNFVPTAFGKIAVKPELFVRDFLSIILGIAGAAATIMLIIGGYRILISRGNKEGVASGRDTITAAVLGILFIVLSIVILEIIGVDILRIPGFTR